MPLPELITFALYLIGMLIVGIIFYRMTGNLSDYILGGRKLGGAVSALSAGASDMSGWLLLGLPGAVYVSGINQSWIAIGLVSGAYLNWQFVAKRLRRYTQLASDSLTLPDYLENRFQDRSRLLRIISALVILVFFTVYTASGLVAGARLFESTFDIDYRIALGVGLLVIVSYTFLGGFLAVSWTDFVQGTLMFFALVIAPIVAIQELGGWNAVVREASNIKGGSIDIFHDTGRVGIISLMAWGLGYFGQPHILARFMAIRSPRLVPQARLIAMVWMVLSILGAIFVGFIGIAFFHDSPIDDSETVFIRLTQALFNPWISGILLAAILSAIMSTVDSQLLVCSSAITEDFYKSFLRRSADEKELVWIGRASVIVIAVIALGIAADPESKVLDLVANAWAGFGASFGPVILLSLFWKGMTRSGALAGMVVGAVTVVVWIQLEGGLFEIYEILPGFLLSSLAIILLSLLEGGPNATIRQEFEWITKRGSASDPIPPA